jgi:oligopeptide/dipeptide ABC transporter ATP-binding protein
VTQSPLLEVRGIKKHYPIKKGLLMKQTGSVKAVDGVDLTVMQQETVGLVGESGCGKSTLGKMIVQLLAPTEGEIHFEGTDLAATSHQTSVRKNIQMIFQDPYSSLNPRQKIGDILMEPFRIHQMDLNESKERMLYLLDKVGLNPGHANRYPHEFSGGQRQRIGIARAIALKPKLVVCDEPVAALDVSIQSQIVNLLEDLQAEFQMSYLFIAHDLAVVRHISHRIGVMYLGSIVELAEAEELFSNPQHPYTKALLSSIPVAHPRMKRTPLILKGDLPNPANPPSGCKFHTRCPYAEARCGKEIPALKGSASHQAACHFVSL